MSFDFNPNVNLTNVQASAKASEGGGGNTGYFQRGQSEEEDIGLNFAKNYPDDSFVKESDLLNEKEPDLSFIDNIFNFFKKIIAKIKTLFGLK